MQMSIERYREVHKLIWNTVIAFSNEVKDGKISVAFFKSIGVEIAYEKGLLDLDEKEIILYRNNCLLCAAYPNCTGCPIGDCGIRDSLYSRAVNGDVIAMIEIRDIVDKPPFTGLSIITLEY